MTDREVEKLVQADNLQDLVDMLVQLRYKYDMENYYVEPELDWEDYADNYDDNYDDNYQEDYLKYIEEEYKKSYSEYTPPDEYEPDMEDYTGHYEKCMFITEPQQRFRKIKEELMAATWNPEKIPGKWLIEMEYND